MGWLIFNIVVVVACFIWVAVASSNETGKKVVTVFLGLLYLALVCSSAYDLGKQYTSQIKSGDICSVEAIVHGRLVVICSSDNDLKIVTLDPKKGDQAPVVHDLITRTANGLMVVKK